VQDATGPRRDENQRGPHDPARCYPCHEGHDDVSTNEKSSSARVGLGPPFEPVLKECVEEGKRGGTANKDEGIDKTHGLQVVA